MDCEECEDHEDNDRCIRCLGRAVSRLEAELKEKDGSHIACYLCALSNNVCIENCERCCHQPKEPGQEKVDCLEMQGSPAKREYSAQSAPETPAPLMICDKVQESCHCWHGTPHVWMGGIYGGCNLSCYKGRDRSMCVPVKAPSKEEKETAIVWDPATSSLTVKKGGKK